MNFISNTPPIKVSVLNSYLFQNSKKPGMTSAYLVAIKAVNGKPITFTVHLETGAVFSSVPLWAIKCNRFNEINLSKFKKETQPYSCLESPIQVITYDLLKDYRVNFKGGTGRYLFTIEYGGQGLAEDPEQFKTHNIIVDIYGNLWALPNNYCLFIDEHFTKSSKKIPKYKRNRNYLVART